MKLRNDLSHDINELKIALGLSLVPIYRTLQKFTNCYAKDIHEEASQYYCDILKLYSVIRPFYRLKAKVFEPDTRVRDTRVRDTRVGDTRVGDTRVHDTNKIFSILELGYMSVKEKDFAFNALLLFHYFEKLEDFGLSLFKHFNALEEKYNE